MSPVQRVDKHAVREQAAPRREQRGRADAVGVPAENRVATSEGEGQEEEREHDEQPEHSFLGECADVGAVRGDR